MAETSAREEAALAECRQLHATIAELRDQPAAGLAGKYEMESKMWELQRALDEAVAGKRRLESQLKEQVRGTMGKSTGDSAAAATVFRAWAQRGEERRFTARCNAPSLSGSP